jgi:hypothetical protein
MEVSAMEELLEFENTVEDPDGRSHVALVLGQERDDGTWIGWIRFTPTDGGPVVETERETTQPNRKDLAYWSTGLTYFYLEGALARAQSRRDGEAAGGGAEAAPAPATAPAPNRPLTGVPRLEVVSRDPAVVEAVLEARDPQPGTAREVPDAGLIVYEGIGGADGESYLFSVQFGSRNAGATLANWLWSRLHAAGAEVRVDGRPVELTNDALNRALQG